MSESESEIESESESGSVCEREVCEKEREKDGVRSSVRECEGVRETT